MNFGLSCHDKNENIFKKKKTILDSVMWLCESIEWPKSTFSEAFLKRTLNMIYKQHQQLYNDKDDDDGTVFIVHKLENINAQCVANVNDFSGQFALYH